MGSSAGKTRDGAAGEVGTRRWQPSLGEEDRAYKLVFSASTSAAVTLPPGTGLVGIMWNSHSSPMAIRVTVAESVAGTYRLLRKSDGSGVFDPYNGTSSSIAGAIFCSDVAPFSSMKIALKKSYASKVTFRMILKG